MKKLIYLFLALVMFLQANVGVAGSHREIDYTLEIGNDCKNMIRNVVVLYDGQDFLDNKDGDNIGYLSGSSYGMPMTIPDVALITWKDSKGKTYEAKVPLSSLIHFSDFFAQNFRVEFHFCDSQLRVIFAKKKRRLEYIEKEIWSNQTGKATTDKNIRK